MNDYPDNPKILCVINPSANAQKINHLEHSLRNLPSKWEVQIVQTKSIPNAKTHLRDVNKTRFTHIIVCGGDGTIHAVLPELRALKIPLYVWPAGTANDFANHLGHTCDEDALIWSIGKSESNPIDIVSLDGILMATSAGIGVGTKTLTTHRLLRSTFLRRWVGIFRSEIYSLLSFLYIIGGRNREFSFKIKSNRFNSTTLNASNVFISNIPKLGKKMTINREANTHDGATNVLAIRSKSRWELLRTFLKIRSGKSDFKKTHMAEDHFEIEFPSKDKVDLFIDGELYKFPPMFKILTLKGALLTLKKAK